MRSRSLRIALVLPLLLAGFGSLSEGKVYLPKDEALNRAFPGADEIAVVNLYLTEEERKEVTRASGAPVESGIYTFYAGKKDDKALGYAAIEAATVRTLPETVMVVMNPDGTVRFVEILAFFEPEEYKPARRWLDQFGGKTLSRELRIGGEIQGISGATLSAQALARQVRKSAAMARLLLSRSRP